MKKERKSRYQTNEKLSSKTSSLLIVVSCISVLMLMIYFGVSITSKGTFSAATPTCPSGTSMVIDGSNKMCCDNSFPSIASGTGVLSSIAHSGKVCTNSNFPSNGVHDVFGGVGRCRTEVIGVTDSTVCLSMGNTVFESNTCFVLNACAKAPVSPQCTSGNISSDWNSCIENTTAQTQSNCPSDGTLLPDGKTCSVQCGFSTLDQCNAAFGSTENNEKCEIGGVSGITCYTCRTNLNSDYEVVNKQCVQTSNNPQQVFTITFMANGGTFSGGGGNSVTRTCITNETSSSCAITAPTITKDGFNFMGWCGESETSCANVTSGITVTSASSDKTYYAVWKAPVNNCVYSDPYVSSAITPDYQNGAVYIDVTSGDKDCCGMGANALNVPGGRGFAPSVWNVNNFWQTNSSISSSMRRCETPITFFEYNGTRYLRHLIGNGKCADGYHPLSDNSRWCVQNICNCDSNCFDDIIGTRCNLSNGKKVTVLTCSMTSDEISGITCSSLNDTAQGTCKVSEDGVTKSVLRCSLGAENHSACDGYTPPVTNPPVTNPPVTNPPVTNPPQTGPSTITRTCYQCVGTNINPATVTMYENETCQSKGYLANNDVSQCRTQCWRCDGKVAVNDVYVAKGQECSSKEGYFASGDDSQCQLTCYYCDGATEAFRVIAKNGNNDKCSNHSGYKDKQSDLNCSSDKKTCFRCVGMDPTPIEIDADEDCSDYENYKSNADDLTCTKTCYYCDGPDRKPTKIASSDKCSNYAGYKDSMNDLTCVSEEPTEYKCCACDGSNKVTKGNTTNGVCPSGQTLCSELVCKNAQTGTGAIVIAWIIGLAAIGYSFYYFRQTNKQ